MTPSVDLRIGAMIRVMQSIIMPAIGDSLAREQAGLIVGHLTILREQVDLGHRFEEFELRAASALAEKLCLAAEGGVATRVAADRLSTLLGQGGPQDITTARARYAALMEALDAMVDAAALDAETAFGSLLFQAMLDFGENHARRNREWFAGMGFDGPQQGSLAAYMEQLEIDVDQVSTAAQARFEPDGAMRDEEEATS